MSPQLTDRMQALLAAVPPLESGTELILRPDADEPVAMLRPEGRPPRVFAWRFESAIELAAADDTRLPGHRLLADRAQLQRHLTPWLGPIDSCSLVAWRPGRRAVLRVTGADQRTHWLKLLDQKTWRRATATFAAFADHDDADPVQFARPVALLHEPAAYLAPDAGGQSLRALIGAGHPLPLDQLGRALRSLATTPTTTALPESDFATARAAAVAMLDKGAVLQPRLAELMVAVATVPAPPTRNRGFVHGDLHDKQIFINGATDRATLIDLEGVSIGDPTFDAVNLAEHVRLRDLQRCGQDRGNADALLTTLVPRPRQELLPWLAVIRARLCGVYALRPRWSTLTTLLQAETAALLEEYRCGSS